MEFVTEKALKSFTRAKIGKYVKISYLQNVYAYYVEPSMKNLHKIKDSEYFCFRNFSIIIYILECKMGGHANNSLIFKALTPNGLCWFFAKSTWEYCEFEEL